MSVATRRPHTNCNKGRGPYSKSRKHPKGEVWRKLYKKELEKYGEQGLYLRGLRHREGLTQKQLAAKLGKGCSQHHISEMENGKRTITPAMAKRLANVLHAEYRMFL
ncbi:MAG: hypothetical protein KR126chlam2_00081 [Chlamydiae bacterium]|nr:hypothetical protein [Chlamydiota bacterium]